ncbi:MAG: sugar phosphate isomerase/epimerase, partial [Lentisphaeria bacterium]|nr:sugar phosphate isomerase/epimerase [Lentisphaeria bacterium]
SWRAIQLYSFREALKANFQDTMKQIAELGYDGVEFAFYFGGMEPDQLADFMKSLGLQTWAVHVNLLKANDPAYPDYTYAKALGARTIICSGKKDGFVENLDELKTQVRAVRDAAKTHGLEFVYHNHAFEFAKLADGSYGYDALVGDDLDVELDVYWLTQGGVDPVEYIKRYGKRLPLLHLKDRNPVTNSFTELGTGDVPLKACVDALEGSICRGLVYEQDICNYPGVESAKISIANIRKILGY